MKRTINYGMLRRIIGYLLFLEGIFMLIPLATCLYYNESDWMGFAGASILTAAIGYLMSRIKPESTRMGRREGFMLTASIWVVFSIFGLIPFMASTHHLGFSSAFFEAMSSFTTTGATTICQDETTLGYGLRLWQALMQWLGGMGIILFTLAILPALNSSGGMQMFNAEVTGITKDKLLPRVSYTAMALWGVYTVLTLIMVALLWIGPMSFYDSLCHAFGTLSTGGFSSRAGGIAEFHSDYVIIVVTIFMFFGGMNIANLYRVALGKFSRIKQDEVIRVYVVAIVVMTLCFIISRVVEGSITNWREVTILPLFQVVSTITSTGYLAPGFTYFAPFLLALTFMMMFSGGCAGSTSGGAKIDRLVYLHKYLGNEIKLVSRPNDILPVRVNGTVIPSEIVSKVVAFLCLYFVCIAVGGIVLSAMGLPAVDSFFSAFSCISNTSFGASVTGYGDDYLMIPDAAKWVLSALMLIGRLEIFTVLVLFSPGFWNR